MRKNRLGGWPSEGRRENAMIYESHAETPQESPVTPSEEAIRLRSRQIWEREGCPDGYAEDHWRRAKAELEAEMKRPAVQSPVADQGIPSASVRKEIVLSLKKNNAVPVRRPLPAMKPMQHSQQNPPMPSIIADDFTLYGTVASAGDIQLDGRVDGTVHAARLVIGEKAVVQGDVIADDVIVHGCVQGTIQARKLLLRTNARVEGDVIYDMLAVEYGATLHGAFRHIGKIDALAETWQAELTRDNAASAAIAEKARPSQTAA